MKLFYLTLIFCCIRLNMIQATSPSHISSETPPSAILAKSFALAADCSGINLDLGTSGPFSFGAGSYVVRASGADTTASFSFDLWDETTSNCVAAGGVNDITFDFKVLETFDAYGGSTMAGYVGASHKIVQDATGLKGTNPHGSSGATVSSTGDVRAYEVTVRFASHIEVLAGDLTVATTSINTAGKAYESAAIVFLDENGDPLDGGDPNYIGFYGANGPAINGTCTPPAATPSPWQGVSLPAQGSYFAQSTGTVDLSVDGCNPSSGSNGSGNNADVLASDVNLATTERIGGFKFMVYLEMVAVASADGISAGVTTSFTSTVNDLIIDNFNFVAPLPVTLSNFSAEATNKDEVQLEWTTEREIDNDYFLLERSENGKDFEKISGIKNSA